MPPPAPRLSYLKPSALRTSQVEDPGLRDLLDGLLRFDPEQRSSAEAALAHPWLSQFVAADALAGGGPGAPAAATEGAPAPAGAPLGAYPSTPRQAPAGGASSGEAGGRVRATRVRLGAPARAGAERRRGPR